MHIKIYQNVQDMSGIGEEWLMDVSNENVMGVFIDGNLRCEIFRFLLPPDLEEENESTKALDSLQ